MQTGAEAEVRVTNGTGYLNLRSLPQLGMLDLSALEGRWIRMDSRSVQQATSSQMTPELPDTPSTKTQKEIRTVIQNNPPITVQEQLGTNIVNGMSARGYAVTLDHENAIQLVRTINSIAKTRDDMTPMSASELQEFENGLKRVSLSGSVWIADEGTKMPLRVQMRMQIDESVAEGVQELFRDSMYAAPIEASMGGNATTTQDSSSMIDSGTFEMNITFIDFDEPVQVTAPEDTMKLQEAAMMIFGQMFKGATAATSTDAMPTEPGPEMF